jgi:hypothetical protein
VLFAWSAREIRPEGEPEIVDFSAAAERPRRRTRRGAGAHRGLAERHGVAPPGRDGPPDLPAAAKRIS